MNTNQDVIQQVIDKNRERQQEAVNAQLAEIKQIAEDYLEDVIISIPDTIFKEVFIPGLFSDDETEFKIHRNHLKNKIGGWRQPFKIINEQGETLFKIPSLSLNYSTNLTHEHPADYSVAETSSLLSNYGHNLLPSQYINTVEEMVAAAEYTLDIERAKREYYLGWYEVMEYFNIIPEDERADYQRVIDDRNKHGHHYYWVHPTPLSQYISQDSAKSSEQRNSSANVEQFKFEETDDWE